MRDRKWAKVIFACYCLLMLWLLFGQRFGAEGLGAVNLKPFRTIRGFWWLGTHSTDPAALWTAAVNLIGNVVMFIPLGYLLPSCWNGQQKLIPFLLTVTVTISCVELLQYGTGLGSMDVDDLILNVPGACLGWLCHAAVRPLISRKTG